MRACGWRILSRNREWRVVCSALGVRAHATEPLFVTLISGSADTTRELASYLRDVGIASRALRTLPRVAIEEPRSTALVLFPDSFDRADVAETIARRRKADRGLLILVVTREPARFKQSSEPIVVLERPAFGWAIVDAIRAHGRRGT